MKKISVILASLLLFSGFLFSQTQLSYRFSNPHVISGTPDVFQFDVDVKADVAGTFQRDLQIYLDYNSFAFGSDIVANGKVSVSTLALMSDHYQVVNLTDNTISKIAVITEAIEELNQSGSSNYFNEVPSTYIGTLRFQVEIADVNEVTGITFDEELMNGGQYLQSVLSTDPIAYVSPNIYENTLSDLSFIGQDIQLSEGWAGISSYMLPFDAEIENIFDPIVNELVILQNFSGTYLPSMGVNTLVNWDNSTGYVVKVDNDCQLKILGSNYEGNAVSLSSGWNLLPILSACDLNTADLFNAVLPSVIIIQEVAGTGIYWPSMGINSLTLLNPGKAYFVKMSASETIAFPVCD
nr:hypothetical protein [Bacteroidota bacterium]